MTLTIGFGPSIFDDRSAWGPPDGPLGASRVPGRRPRSGEQRRRPRGSRRAPTTRRSPSTRSGTSSAWASVSVRPVRSSASAVRRPRQGGQATPRNLFGFKDGTNNLKAEDWAVLDALVWVRKGDGADWIAGAPTWSRVVSGCSWSLGPLPLSRAGADLRPDQGRLRPAGQRRRVRPRGLHEQGGDGEPLIPRPRTSAWPTPSIGRRPRPASRATTSSMAPTVSAAWTPACSSSPTSATRASSSFRSSGPWPSPTSERVHRTHDSAVFACPPGPGRRLLGPAAACGGRRPVRRRQWRSGRRRPTPAARRRPTGCRSARRPTSPLRWPCRARRRTGSGPRRQRGVVELVGVTDAVAVAVGAVTGPGAGQELHRADGPVERCVAVEAAAVGVPDLAARRRIRRGGHR